jgi:hypothetical protein
MYQLTDTGQGKRWWNGFVFELFMRWMTVESVLTSSHVEDSIIGECIAIDHQADLGWQTEEVEGLFMAVAEFVLSTKTRSVNKIKATSELSHKPFDKLCSQTDEA